MRGHGCRIDFEAVIAGLSFIGLGPCPIEMVPRFYDLPQSYQEKGEFIKQLCVTMFNPRKCRIQEDPVLSWNELRPSLKSWSALVQICSVT